MGICVDEPAQFEELDHVDPTLPVFSFGDKGLGSSQFVRQLLLGKACVLAGLDQDRQQDPIRTLID